MHTQHHTELSILSINTRTRARTQCVGWWGRQSFEDYVSSKCLGGLQSSNDGDWLQSLSINACARVRVVCVKKGGGGGNLGLRCKDSVPPAEVPVTTTSVAVSKPRFLSAYASVASRFLIPRNQSLGWVLLPGTGTGSAR